MIGCKCAAGVCTGPAPAVPSLPAMPMPAPAPLHPTCCARRAELLARCNGPAGKKYVLRSGATPFNPYGASCNFNTPNLFEQSIIATINLTTASAWQLWVNIHRCYGRWAGTSVAPRPRTESPKSPRPNCDCKDCMPHYPASSHT